MTTIQSCSEFLNEATLSRENVKDIKQIFLKNEFIDSVKHIVHLPNNVIWCGTVLMDYKLDETATIVYYQDSLSKLIKNNKVNEYFKEAFDEKGYPKENTKPINIFQEDLKSKTGSPRIKTKEIGDDDMVVTDSRFRKTCYGILLMDKDVFYFIISLYKIDIDTIATYRNILAKDWERLITLAWNHDPEAYEEYKNINKLNDYYDWLGDMSNISPFYAKNYDPNINDNYRVYVESSDIIKDKLRDVIPNSYTFAMEFIKSDKDIKTGEIWSKYTNETKQSHIPKTDMILLNNDTKYKISLKKMGGSQLYSGNESETKTLFYSVLEKYDNDIINDLFNDKWEKINLEDDSNITKIKQDTNHDLYTKELYKKVLDSSDTHKILTKKIKELFEKNIDFKKDIIHEMLTGDIKYGGDSDYSATHLLIFSEDGDMKFRTINSDLIAEIVDEVDFNISFKTSGKISYTALRALSDMTNVSGYNGDEDDRTEELIEEPIIVEKFTDWIINNKYTRKLSNIFNNIKTYISNLLKNKIDEVLKLFGIELDIKIKNNYKF